MLKISRQAFFKVSVLRIEASLPLTPKKWKIKRRRRMCLL